MSGAMTWTCEACGATGPWKSEDLDSFGAGELHQMGHVKGSFDIVPRLYIDVAESA
jgi:hypothetical protein